MEIEEKHIARFWSRVNKDGPTMSHMDTPCWVWTGWCTEKGYGVYEVKNKAIKTHRLSYVLQHGSIPDGRIVCHRCDNPACVRPDHLFAGTYRENLVDALRKGRKNPPSHTSMSTYARGERVSSAKLNSENVRSIRELRKQGMSARDIAPMFGITHWHVYSILRGDNWAHVD